jgi:hypothetical protein
MGKPTEAELKIALEEAARMREHDQDPHHIAKALLNIHYRNRYLEKVLRAAERYLHSGQGASAHTQLVRSINEYNAIDLRTSGEDPNPEVF